MIMIKFLNPIDDPLHSNDEKRLVLIGMSYNNRILVVVHTEKGGNIRIISARKATKKERKYYEKEKKELPNKGIEMDWEKLVCFYIFQ